MCIAAFSYVKRFVERGENAPKPGYNSGVPDIAP